MTLKEFKQSVVDQYNATGVICEDEIKFAYEEAGLPEDKFEKVLKELGTKMFIEGPIREIDGEELKKEIIPDKSKDYNAAAEYVKEISKYPKYPKEMELNFARIMKDPSRSEQERKDARNKLICSNLRYIPYLASKYKNNVPFMDLVQEGSLALIKCLDSFDPERNCAVITYASWWIKLAIRNEAFAHNNMISLPVSIRKYIATIKTLEDEKRSTNEPYQFNDLLKASGAPRHVWPTIKLYLHQAVSLSTEVYDKGNSLEKSGSTLGDFIPDEAINIEEEVESNMASDAMEALLKIIPKERDRKIIIMRLGLDGSPRKTLSQIGAELDPPITRERVRQIYNMKLNLLRKSPYAQDLKELWDK